MQQNASNARNGTSTSGARCQVPDLYETGASLPVCQIVEDPLVPVPAVEATSPSCCCHRRRLERGWKVVGGRWEAQGGRPGGDWRVQSGKSAVGRGALLMLSVCMLPVPVLPAAAKGHRQTA
ncbi:hypothetical protein GLAREA_03795 [Glarea lozoyensis ATCC 20868]|uniref:Uncharacterized protein n=1 Tax=Glarea lozoyensis (strain ATCC 20868 / MF5171) TaxID=1116229 RepID=S3DWT8_GLAL2|nr:uncharacterized protein GLAREA_03795 [Glarea lozoyensis ATCC 20868]EPE30828.1 hypothetical protein GLAREA_03795 [Glarea lozoyensis ATCC 20868]